MDKENSGKVRRFRSPEYCLKETVTTEFARDFYAYNELNDSDKFLSWLMRNVSETVNDGTEVFSAIGKGYPKNLYIMKENGNEYKVTQKENQYTFGRNGSRKKSWHYLRYLEIKSVPENAELPKELSDKLKEFGYEELNN